MKNGWPTKTLGEVCGFVRGPFGGSLKKSVFVEDGFAVYEQQHAIYNQFEDIRYFIDDAKFREMQRFELRPNDLIMSCSGTMGRVAIAPKSLRRGIINQALLKLSPSSAVLPEFLKYWMESTGFQDSLSEQAGGVAIQNVASVSILKEIKMPLPPLPEQQRIVGILDEAFAGIATAKANAEKNFQNARALFESHLQSVFSQPGQGWVKKPLEGLGSIRTGKHDANHQVEDGPYPFYTCAVGQFRSPTFSFDGASIILPGNGANVGKVFFYDGKFEAYQRTYIVNELIDTLNPRFLFYCFSAGWAEHIATKQFGSATNYIVVGGLKSFPVPTPPLSVQEATVEHLDTLAEETQRLETIYRQKLAALEELKKSLLHRAFAGEL